MCYRAFQQMRVRKIEIWTLMTSHSPGLSISMRGGARLGFAHDFSVKPDLDRKVFVREEGPSAVVLAQPDEVKVGTFSTFSQNFAKKWILGTIRKIRDTLWQGRLFEKVSHELFLLCKTLINFNGFESKKFWKTLSFHVI